MTKRKERELFFQLLFMVNFYPQKQWLQQLENFLSAQPLPEKEADVFRSRFREISGCLPKIDERIAGSTEGWKLSRLAKVDLTLLRLAVFEIVCEGLKKEIAINEAVEIAKLYGSDRSYAFVNGVLARLDKSGAIG